MKKILTLLIVIVHASCASAGIMDVLTGCRQNIEYATKSAIHGAEPIEYRGLKLSGENVRIIIINRSPDKTYKFNATCALVNERGIELGDFFIPEITLEPKQQLPLKNLYFKGDTKSAKVNAKSLNWTIYKLEEVK